LLGGHQKRDLEPTNWRAVSLAEADPRRSFNITAAVESEIYRDGRGREEDAVVKVRILGGRGIS